MPQRIFLNVLLLWLIGNALRLTLLAVPPVIPAIHADLGLSGTGVGLLGGLPVIVFAAAALPGSLMIARLGPVRAVVVGLFVMALAGALRGAVATATWLYATTIAMAAGIAIMQPAMPALVRLWMPHRIGFATAIYSNGLLTGEIFPALLTLPAIVPLVHGSWGLALAFWSLPVLAIAVFTMVATPQEAGKPSAAAPARWWPNWRDGLIWRLGVSFGSVNSIYFGTNTFLPDYLASHGRADLISAALSALNFGQLPASLMLLALAGQFERRAWPFVAFGLLALAGIGGIVATAGAWTVASAAVLGFAGAGILVLVLALPPLLCAPADVAPVSAAMMTVSYTLAMLTAVISGAMWDLTGVPAAAFAPLAVCGVVILIVPATIKFNRPAEHQAS